jgi:hypothetical protein
MGGRGVVGDCDFVVCPGQADWRSFRGHRVYALSFSGVLRTMSQHVDKG